MTHCIKILAHFLCTLYFIAINTSADSDWLQECGKCKCKWSSGKKYADCKNSSLYRIPLGLSSELQVLDLSFNSLQEIRKQEFSHANLQNLHKLFIRNCSLRDISRDSLKSLQILIELDFSNNLIRILHAGIFNGLVKLRTVILNNNIIERLDDKLFENLIFLHKIELKENQIHRISQNVFVNVPVLSQIYLDSNSLKTLRRESFHNLDRLTSLSLSQNPWNCSCELKSFRDYTIEKNLYTPPTDCQEPEILRGKLWSELLSEHFACRPKILAPHAGASIDASSENITLTCRIRGSPTPDVTWLYNKQPLNYYERRIHIKKLVEKNTRDTMETVTSELTIVGVRTTDKGSYSCIAKNRGGRDEAEILLGVPLNFNDQSDKTNASLYMLLILCLISVALLIIIIGGMIFKIKKQNIKEPINNENNHSVIKMGNSKDEFECEDLSSKEMHSSVLTEVNPIEKPARRAYIELNGNGVIGHRKEIDKVSINETVFGMFISSNILSMLTVKLFLCFSF